MSTIFSHLLGELVAWYLDYENKLLGSSKYLQLVIEKMNFIGDQKDHCLNLSSLFLMKAAYLARLLSKFFLSLCLNPLSASKAFK